MTVTKTSLLLIITSVPHLTSWTIQYVTVQDSYGPLNFTDLFGSSLLWSYSHTHLIVYVL